MRPPRRQPWGATADTKRIVSARTSALGEPSPSVYEPGGKVSLLRKRSRWAPMRAPPCHAATAVYGAQGGAVRRRRGPPQPRAGQRLLPRAGQGPLACPPHGTTQSRNTREAPACKSGRVVEPRGAQQTVPVARRCAESQRHHPWLHVRHRFSPVPGSKAMERATAAFGRSDAFLCG